MKKTFALLGLLSCAQSWGAQLTGPDHPLFEGKLYEEDYSLDATEQRTWRNWSGSRPNLRSLIFGGLITWWRRKNYEAEVEAPSLEQLHHYLHEPITLENPIMLEALMISGKGVNINNIGPDGLTILMRKAKKLATELPSSKLITECIRLILEFGGDPYLVNASGESAESIANRYEYTFDIQKLLTHQYIGLPHIEFPPNIINLFNNILNDPYTLANLAQLTEFSVEIEYLIKQLQKKPELLNELKKSIPQTLKAQALLRSLEGLAFNKHMTPWNMPGVTYKPLPQQHHSPHATHGTPRLLSPTTISSTPPSDTPTLVTLARRNASVESMIDILPTASNEDKKQALIELVDYPQKLDHLIKVGRKFLSDENLTAALEKACILKKQKSIEILLTAGTPISDKAYNSVKVHGMHTLLEKFSCKPSNDPTLVSIVESNGPITQMINILPVASDKDKQKALIELVDYPGKLNELIQSGREYLSDENLTAALEKACILNKQESIKILLTASAPISDKAYNSAKIHGKTHILLEKLSCKPSSDPQSTSSKLE